MTETQLLEELKRAYLKGKSDGLDIGLKHIEKFK